MENTKIEWANHTFNPWMGCTKVSPACKNCYAERDMDQRFGRVQWGDMGTRVLTNDANWRKPLKWNREAAESGVRARVFCASLADVFEDWRGPMMFAGTQPVYVGKDFRASSGPDLRATMDDVRERLFGLIDATPNLDWLLLTKRPQNIRRMWPIKRPCNCGSTKVEVHSFECNSRRKTDFRLDNVWIGTSVENQEQADKRIPELLQCRDLSPVLFLSCEPLLGPLDLTDRDGGSRRRYWNWLNGGYFQETWDGGGGVVSSSLRKIDWVIAGGESGANARPSHPSWFHSLRDQCTANGVPFLFKQWGGWLPTGQVTDPTIQSESKQAYFFPDRKTSLLVGKKAAGRLLDGREWNEFPEVATCNS